MTCEERKDLLLLYVTGALEPAEAAEVRTHLATGCPACAGALAEAEATVHRIPLGLQLQAAPEEAWEKIETRIALKDQMDEHPPATLAAPFAPPVKSRAWIGWATAAVLAVVLGMPLWNAHSQLARDRDAIAALRIDADRAKTLETRVVDLERQIKSRSDDNAKLAALVEKILRSDEFVVEGKEQPNVQGKLLWDRTDNTWTLHSANVQTPAGGKTYELWIIPVGGKPIAAGIAKPDSAGKLVMEAKIPPDAGPLAMAAVTDEPGLVDAPTGKIQFAATVVKQ